MEAVEYTDRQHYLSETSLRRLEGVDPRLIDCVERVSGMLVDLNVQVLEGKRTEESITYTLKKE